MLVVLLLDGKTYPELVQEIEECMEKFDFEGARWHIQYVKFWSNYTEVHLEVGGLSRDESTMLAKVKDPFNIMKGNQNYRKGRSFEYRVMDKLRKQGWDCIRSYRSWGPADVRAFRDGTMLYIQAKWSVHGQTQPDHYALDGLVDMAAQFGGIPVFAGIMNRRIYFVDLLTGEEYNIE